MKKTIFAALLSAFVWPGTGHLFIGLRKRGWVFAGLGALLIVYILLVFVPMANRVAGSIDPSTSIGLVGSTIETRVLEEVSMHGGMIFPAVLGLLLLWLVALFDVLRLARRGSRAG